MKPPLIGVSILTAWLAFLLCLAVLLNWWSRGWSFAVGGDRIHWAKWTGLLSLVLLVGFEFAFLYNGNNLVPCTTTCKYEYSYVGSSWIWLGNNLVLVSLAIYTWTSGKSQSLSCRGLLVDLLKQRSSGVTSPTATAVLFQLMDRVLQPNAPRNFWFGSSLIHAGIYYAASLAVLIIYMILNLVLSSNAVDSGRWAGSCLLACLLYCVLLSTAHGRVCNAGLQVPGLYHRRHRRRP